MNEPWASECSFRSAAVADDGYLLVACSIDRLDDEGEQHTVVAARAPRGLRRVCATLWQSNLPVFVAGDMRAPLLIGRDGEVAVPTPQLDLQAPCLVVDSDRVVAGVTAWDGGVVLCGFAGLVYQSDDGVHWQRLDRPVLASHDFYAVSVNPNTGILCVGRSGAAWLYDFARWHRMELPTNVDLTAVAPHADGWLIAGRDGFVALTDGQRCKLPLADRYGSDFWGAASLGERNYISSTTSVFELRGDSLLPIDGDIEMGYTSCQLQASASHIVSVGTHDILQFDGQRWEQL